MQEHRGEAPSKWAAVQSTAPRIGCSVHTLLKWIQLHDVEAGTRPGVPVAEHERIKAFECEVKEFAQAAQPRTEEVNAYIVSIGLYRVESIGKVRQA